MKTITLEQIGWHIAGEATINPWGGGQGPIEMDSSFIPLGTLTKDRIHMAINDGRFGCESIEGAWVAIYEVYQHRSGKTFKIHRTTLEITNPNPELVCRGIE